MTEKEKVFVLASSSVIAGSLLTYYFGFVSKRSTSKGTRKYKTNPDATHSVTDSEKFHVNVAAGASVSIPITAQGDIDITLASGNGDNKERATRSKDKQQEQKRTSENIN